MNRRGIQIEHAAIHEIIRRKITKGGVMREIITHVRAAGQRMARYVQENYYILSLVFLLILCIVLVLALAD